MNIRDSTVLTKIRQGGSLDKGDEQEGEGKDGLGQHVEERNARWIVVVLRKKELEWAPGLLSKRRGV
jgi:hypothetical protein